MPHISAFHAESIHKLVSKDTAYFKNSTKAYKSRTPILRTGWALLSDLQDPIPLFKEKKKMNPEIGMAKQMRSAPQKLTAELSITNLRVKVTVH